jgi:hypothetical protein
MTNNQQDPYLISVTVVYCDKNGKQWEKELDLEKVGGLWWNNPPGAGSGTHYPPGQKQLIGDCGPQVPLERGTTCWYDNNTGQWVCPEGLG